MSNIVLISLVVLGVLGGVLAAILYFVAQKFKVEENPLIDEVESALSGANCGGCGFAGCRNFAENCVKSAAEKKSLEGLHCPSSDMQRVAELLSLTVEAAEPQVAVVRCNGTCENSPSKVVYEGASICAFAATQYAGEGGCSKGCLGLGDCVSTCSFGALHINPETRIAEVDEEKCVGCGACVKACPRNIIEIRPKGKNNRRVFVSCVNTDKGAITMKNCKVGCIGCQKCLKTCPFEAIEMRGSLAYIDPKKCKSCRKCVEACPRNTIVEVNFPPRKPKATTTEGDAKAEKETINVETKA